jgi:basic amino acid/polyamine antiporter, APA family
MPSSSDDRLVREISLGGATALNMIDMIGVGPFITIPLIIAAMGGPQAMLGWIIGAVLAVCDGLVWAELGAAMPGSGGSYRYLNEIYGPKTLGKLFSFLFIWQLSFSAPLSIASGCIGLALYAGFIFPGLEQSLALRSLNLELPLLGPMQVQIPGGSGTAVAIGALVVALFLLYRRVGFVEKISKFLWLGVMGTIGWVIFAGLTNFNAQQAFDFPPRAFDIDRRFFAGLGAALLVATYDYWGYYNVCFFGDEVKDPARNIPRALLYSIAAVAAIYVVMNISILGVIPWRELEAAAHSGKQQYVISTMMERLYGHTAGVIAAVLIIWTAFASVFSLLLGYSRVPYAAARDGNYFRVFGAVHPQHRIPHVSLIAMGGVAMLFCFFKLADVIAALVVIRIIMQFLVQIVGLLYLRETRPEAPRPFRMWFYPIPAVAALAFFLFVLFSRDNFERQVRYAAVILLLGLTIYGFRAWRRREWPFSTVAESSAHES